MESHKLIKLFSDRNVENPLQVIQGFLSQIGVGIDDDAILFYDANPGIVSDYGGASLSSSFAFFMAHASKIAMSKNVDVESLDFEEMRLSEFFIPETGCNCILMAVPCRK